MDAIMKALSIASGAYDAMLWRSVAGLIVCVPLVVARPFAWPDRARWWLHARRSVASGISVLLFFWGLVRVPMAEGVALCFLAPVLAILLAALLLGERIRLPAILACLMAFAGVGVIVLGKAQAGEGPEAFRGAIAILLASLVYSYNLVLLRSSALQAGPIEITVTTNLFMTAMFALAAPWAAHAPHLDQLPAIAGATLLGVASQLLLAWAYAHAEAQRIVPVEYTAFVWSAILGWLVFGERVLPFTVAGAVLIVAGCWVATWGKAVAAPSSEAAL